MAYTIRCTVHEIGRTEQLTDKFKKRELVVEFVENLQYPEYLSIQALNANCEKLDELRAGDQIELHFNIKGKIYKKEGRPDAYFNSLTLWKFDVLKTTAYKAPEYAPPIDLNSGSDDDDLPF